MILFDEIKLKNPEFSEKNSYQWFIKNVTEVAKKSNVRSMDVLSENKTNLTRKIIPGKMYSFFYSAKYKDELPYWDAMPLIFPFSMDASSFHGLNLHYLPPRHRLLLINNLMPFLTNKDNNEQAKLKLSWNLLSNASKFPQVAPCVKQYLKSHVKSMFVEIPLENWKMMAFMPVARFKGKSEDQVHSLSRRAIGK
jgi:hypothetical protein